MEAYRVSYWEWESFFKDLDVLIIGSGITGLSAAIALKEAAPKRNVMVVDRGPLPIGASTRNAGFACFGSLSELLDDLAHNDRTSVLDLVAQRYAGLQRLRERYGDNAIGYEPLGGYEVFRPEDEALYDQCLAALPDFNADLRTLTGIDTYRSVDERIAGTGFRNVRHLLFNQAEGQLHTGRLMKTLLHRAQSLGVHCLGGVTVESTHEINGRVLVHTAHGWTLTAGRCLITTNGFARSLVPELDLQPARNQVLITEPIPDLPWQGCFHYDRGYVYFRNVGPRVLLGGGRNLDPAAEQTTALGKHPGIRAYLERLLREVILPGRPVPIDRWWSGIMGVGPVKEPIVRPVGERTVVAVRLGGMGVALGTEVGERAAEMVG